MPDSMSLAAEASTLPSYAMVSFTRFTIAVRRRTMSRISMADASTTPMPKVISMVISSWLPEK